MATQCVWSYIELGHVSFYHKRRCLRNSEQVVQSDTRLTQCVRHVDSKHSEMSCYKSVSAMTHESQWYLQHHSGTWS